MTGGLSAQMRQKYNGFLIAYGLFYETASSSVYITPTDTILSECWNGKEMEGSDCDLISGTILAFACK